MVQDKHRHDALEKLREIGVMHIEKTNASSDGLSKILERKARAEDAVGLIAPYKAPKKKKNSAEDDDHERRKDYGPRRGRRATDKMGMEELEPYSLDAINAPARPDLINLMNGMGSKLKAMEQLQASFLWERGRIAAWGEFDPAKLNELANTGYPVFLYELPHETFKTIPNDTCFVKVNEDKASVRVLVIGSEIPDMPLFQLPEKPLSKLDADLAELEKNLGDMEAKIKSFADRRPLLAKDMAAINMDIDFEEVAAEFGEVEGVPENLAVCFLKGYAPSETMDGLKAAAAINCWALAIDDPVPEDATPTRLKNSRFVQLLTPLTGFLDLVPGYNEVDISPWFLMFFAIFFGMLFGDAAYGTLLLLLAIFGIIKTAKTGVPLPVRLLFLLSVSNVLWGILTCSWFGIDTDKLPWFLRDISLSYFSTAKGTSTDAVNQNLQIFCFSLALIHLSIARIGGFFRCIRRGDLKLFAHLGTMAILWGMYNVILAIVVSKEGLRVFPILPISLYLLGGGFLLNFIFCYYSGSISKAILESLKNIISLILGVSGVFSDIMSYIRLWAVGLAGASLAATFNNLAGPMLGNFLIFFGIILLTFGHGLNIVLNTLSVLVHGVRLNILEFSGHVGLTWSGIAYKPFAETAKK